MFQTQKLRKEPDYNEPNGSNIFLLSKVTMAGGQICICELPVGQTTQAVSHRTVEEIWFFLSGKGEIWRKMDGQEVIENVSKNKSITIPFGCHFQYRNTGDEPLRFIIVTMPPWSGADETNKVDNYWKLK